MALKITLNIFDETANNYIETQMRVFSEETRKSNKRKLENEAKRFRYPTDSGCFIPNNPSSYRKGAFWMTQDLKPNRLYPLNDR